MCGIIGLLTNKNDNTIFFDWILNGHYTSKSWL